MAMTVAEQEPDVKDYIYRECYCSVGSLQEAAIQAAAATSIAADVVRPWPNTIIIHELYLREKELQQNNWRNSTELDTNRGYIPFRLNL